MEKLRRLDRAVARIEGGIAVVVLLSMVLVASAQALFFNIAERNVAWAQAALGALSWSDAFLQKGTLWLAFIGASLATAQDKHIAVDVLPKLVSKRSAAMMRSFAAFASGAIAFLLAWVFFQACLIADAAIPLEYEVLTPSGPAHVCDAGVSGLRDTERPFLLCALRTSLAWLHVPLSSGSGIAQLIAPAMLAVMGVRFVARGVALSIDSLGGTSAPSGSGRPPVPGVDA